MTEKIEVSIEDIQQYGCSIACWLAYLRVHKRCTCEEMAEAFGINRKTVQNKMALLETYGMVQRIYAETSATGKPPLIGVRLCL